MKGKRNVKKLLAVLLALAMIIPGVYFGDFVQDEVEAAENVSTEMLQVKVQISEDGEDVIRFITSVDGLEYSKVGFEVLTSSGWITWDTKTVYERIVSNVTHKEYEFSPKVVDVTAKYFVTAKFHAEANVDYQVRAFVTTLDEPETKIYGPTRTVALSDANDNIINLMVDFATTKNDTYDVYDGSTKIGTGKVINDKNVRITLSSKEALDFPSATKLSFQSDSAEVGTAIYRNYYTSYAEDGADTTWYEVDKSAKSFIIASSADLYGLAKIINEQMDETEFANDTITLIRNVVINEDMTNPIYEWERIGTQSIGFAGVFDGDFNTISGILDVKTNTSGQQMHGFFANITSTGCAKNFKLDDSKFEFFKESVYKWNEGAVVGYLQGNLENIYVGENVTIDTDVMYVGGLVGMTSGSSMKTIKNCWFAGTIESINGYAGGILGIAYSGSTTLNNCLNTGTITTTKGPVGGFVGQAAGVNTTILNSISAGEVQTAATNMAGSVIGNVAKTVNIENVYTTDEVTCTTAGAALSTTNSAVGYGTWNADATVAIKGLPIKDADGSVLQGAGAYLNTELDFWSSQDEDGVWMAIEGKMPELKKWSDEAGIATLDGKRASEGWYYAAFERPGTANAALARADAATYELDSVADLNGFAKVLNDTTNGELFVNDKVQLTADINLNPGWVPNVNASGAILNAPAHQWDPAGTLLAKDGTTNVESKTMFSGTFDGQGYTISGIYVEAVVRDVGIFGITAKTAQIKNFRLSNSYIDSNGKDWSGCVVGTFRGTLMENIYVDDSVTLVANGCAGGISGMSSLNYERTYSKCWFAGTIYAGSSQVGGILGSSYAGTNIIENCLYTGKITNTYTGSTQTGGLVGNAVSATKTVVKDSVALGEISVKNTLDSGAEIGFYTSAKTTIEDVYSTNNISHATNDSATFELKAGTVLVIIDEVFANPATALPNLSTDAWDLTAGKLPEVKWK